MLAFDTASETFRLMSRPPEERAAGESTSARALLEIDGELSAVVIQFFSRRRWPFGTCAQRRSGPTLLGYAVVDIHHLIKLASTI
jgi:hypothetical protein